MIFKYSKSVENLAIKNNYLRDLNHIQLLKQEMCEKDNHMFLFCVCFLYIYLWR